MTFSGKIAESSGDDIFLYETVAIGLNRSMAKRNMTEKTISDAAPADRQAGSQDIRAGHVTFEDLLVAVSATSSRDSFIRLFEHFAPRIKSFFMGSGLSADIADELAQDTMLTVWDKARQYDPAKAAASTWIFTIARNKRIDYLRKNARPAPDPQDSALDFAGERPAPDEAVLRHEQSLQIAKALQDLPPAQADMIYKSFFEDKTHQDIADETALPLGTVKSRIRLAMDRLRAYFDENVK